MINKLVVHNYRQFRKYTIDFVGGLNILVGDNDVGKSTILEAINLVLTFRLNGRPISQELSPYLVNMDATEEWVDLQKQTPGTPVAPPRVLVELYLDDDEDYAKLKGTNNSKGEDCCGVRLEARLSSDFGSEFENFVSDPSNLKLVPTEYYEFDWRSFADNKVTTRSLPTISPVIDPTTIRLQSGVDHHLQQIISNHLTDSERVELSREYRNLREEFNDRESVKAVNDRLQDDDNQLSSRQFSLSVDISRRYTWEGSLAAHLDDLPFQFIGKGEQNALKTLLAIGRKAETSKVVLLEEPENHLSFSSMRGLLKRLADRCEGKQLIVATHSAYVLNKLGLEGLVLLGGDAPVRIDSQSVTPDTVEYFKRLPGFDTLRLALADEAILVEGASDELVVQRAYLDEHGRLPLDDGIDVISVGLSHRRFLELAVGLGKRVRVVRDNDGHDVDWVRGLYGDLADHKLVSVHTNTDPQQNTLEPSMIACNDPQELAKVVGCKSAGKLAGFLEANKSEWALSVFESDQRVSFPQYILEAVTS